MEPIVFKPKYKRRALSSLLILVANIPMFIYLLSDSNMNCLSRVFFILFIFCWIVGVVFLSLRSRIRKIIFDGNVTFERYLMKDKQIDYTVVYLLDHKALKCGNLMINPVELSNAPEFYEIIYNLVNEGKIQVKLTSEKKKKANNAIAVVVLILFLTGLAAITYLEIDLTLISSVIDSYLGFSSLALFTYGAYKAAKLIIYRKLRVEE